MDWYAYLDASALAKRYAIEPGTATVNYVFQRIPTSRMMVLNVGVAEVLSLLVRKRNRGLLTDQEFTHSYADFEQETLLPKYPWKLEVSNDLTFAALPLIEKHSINSTDAIALRSALDVAALLRTAGHDLFLAASDQRLLRAAQAEGLATFDPETQTPADLVAILGP